MAGMNLRGDRSTRDPLLGVERLLIDGTNLLYRMSRDAVPARAASARSGTVDQPAAARAPAALIGRLRAVIPAATRIELVLDGSPEHGLAGVRLAHGLTVRHSGRYSADSLLDRLVVDAIGSGGTPDSAARTADVLLVVTDDRELAGQIRRRGARVASAQWLIGRLERTRLSAPSVGAARPPAAGLRPQPGTSRQAPEGASEDDGERPGWRSGRGATTKKGNPRRRARMRP
jgi:hypothetical protein